MNQRADDQRGEARAMTVIRKLTHTHVDLHLKKASVRRQLRELVEDGIPHLQSDVRELVRLLDEHIEQEELHIFPDACRLLRDDHAVDHLLDEHRQLEALAASLTSLAHSPTAPASRELVAAFEALDRLLEQHSDLEAQFFDTHANLINPAIAGGA